MAFKPCKDLLVTCPVCGQPERVEIALGYYRCLGQNIVERQGPGYMNPSMGPPILYDLRACGAEYADPGSVTRVESCECGNFAIGACKKCETAVCGLHSTQWPDARLCEHHSSLRRQAQIDEETRRKEEQVAEATEQLDREQARSIELGEPQDRNLAGAVVLSALSNLFTARGRPAAVSHVVRDRKGLRRVQHVTGWGFASSEVSPNPDGPTMTRVSYILLEDGRVAEITTTTGWGGRSTKWQSIDLMASKQAGRLAADALTFALSSGYSVDELRPLVPFVLRRMNGRLPRLLAFYPD